jgi:hypothetical protein
MDIFRGRGFITKKTIKTKPLCGIYLMCSRNRVENNVTGLLHRGFPEENGTI